MERQASGPARSDAGSSPGARASAPAPADSGADSGIDTPGSGTPDFDYPEWFAEAPPPPPDGAPALTVLSASAPAAEPGEADVLEPDGDYDEAEPADGELLDGDTSEEMQVPDDAEPLPFNEPDALPPPPPPESPAISLRPQAVSSGPSNPPAVRTRRSDPPIPRIVPAAPPAVAAAAAVASPAAAPLPSRHIDLPDPGWIAPPRETPLWKTAAVAMLVTLVIAGGGLYAWRRISAAKLPATTAVPAPEPAAPVHVSAEPAPAAAEPATGDIKSPSSTKNSGKKKTVAKADKTEKSGTKPEKAAHTAAHLPQPAEPAGPAGPVAAKESAKEPADEPPPHATPPKAAKLSNAAKPAEKDDDDSGGSGLDWLGKGIKDTLGHVGGGSKGDAPPKRSSDSPLKPKH